jgi:hypothetical protein
VLDAGAPGTRCKLERELEERKRVKDDLDRLVRDQRGLDHERPRLLTIEIVDFATAPGGLLYKIAVSHAGSDTCFLHKQATDIQDFHAAMQRELGEGSTCKLPPLPVLFEFQTRLMGCQCQKAINAYFNELVRIPSAVETYTFHNFLLCPRFCEAKLARSNANTSVGKGAFLLSPDATQPATRSEAPLSCAVAASPEAVDSERIDFTAGQQPEEEPALVDGSLADLCTCVPRTLLEMPRTCLEMPKFAGDVEPKKAGLCTIQEDSCARDRVEVVKDASSTPVRSTLMDDLSEAVQALKARNKVLVGRLQEIEAALVTKGSTDASVSPHEGVASLPEPFPEPPRAMSTVRSR